MRRRWSIITWILIITLLCGQMPLRVFAQEEITQEGIIQEGSTISSEMTVTGDSSFGTMMANELSAEMTEQKENNGYNVFSVEMQGESAVVSFESVEDAVLVIGIYDETGTEQLTSASMEIYAGETTAVIDFETGSIPQYFYIMGYLIEPMTYRPLCTVYESPMYTQEMQEFLAKTTSDFEAERVLNLDEDESNNFAVYSEETILIPGDTDQNEVVSADESNNIYVIENADSNVMELQAGDIFAYPYQENDVLIVKVASITVDGTTVTITGADASMEEVFDYIKIDTEMGSGEATVDASSCGDGVTYEGLVDYADEDTPQTYEIEIEGSAEKAFELEIDKKVGESTSEGDTSVSISGGLEMQLEFSAKVYLSFSKQYIELKIDYSAKLSADVSGAISAEIPLITVAFIPVTGIIVELTPSFVVEANASVSIAGTLSGTVGFQVQSGEGIKNLTSCPKFKTSMKVEGTIFIGFSICPRVKILSDKVASASLIGKVGAEVKATRKDPFAVNENERHECDLCIKGEINGKLTMSASVKLLNKKSFGFTLPSLKIKISDFYYSADKDSFGWSKCPYDLYKGKVIIVNANNNPMQYVSVKLAANGNILTTDKDGTVEFWLPEGEQSMEISRTNYKTVERILSLEKGGECLQVKLEKVGSANCGGDDGGDGDAGENEEITLEKVIEQVCLGASNSAAITKEGDLYLWGYNFYGQLGDGTKENSLVPKQIMSDMKSVDFGEYHSAAITKEGDLFLWGGNFYGQLGDGTEGQCLEPKKIMSGVQTVSLSLQHSAAITEKGDLYLWGNNSYGQLGDGTTENSIVPKKIMSEVKTVELGDFLSAAITEEGDLYLWGSNFVDHLGGGTVIDSLVPKKVMSDIKAVSLGVGHSAIITEEGDLYLWGSNFAGQLGDGTKEDSSMPKKIMSDVKEVCLGMYHSAAITEEGDLYMWGQNCWNGQLGDGTKKDILVPKKILSNVKAVSLGTTHSGAITEEGDLYLWGDNEYGQFGNETTIDSYIPIQIAIPNTAKAIDEISFFSTRATEEITVTSEQASNWNGTNFTDLTPNETYNYYVMQDRNADQPFATENLNHIGQAVADENGSLSVAFSEEVAASGGDIFAVPMHQMDLSNAEVGVADLTYSGEEQYTEVLVYYGDTLLEEGVDYNVTGDHGVTDVGDYTLNVEGIGLYTGAVSADYQVILDEEYSIVSGTVTCAGDESESTTLKLLDNNGAVVAETSVTGNSAEYMLEDVVSGSYTMQVSKQNHVTREYSLTVDEETVIQDVEICLLGDSVGDGVINAKDKKILYNYIASSMPSEAYALAVADVNSDGSVNAKDKKMLYNHIAGISLLW